MRPDRFRPGERAARGPGGVRAPALRARAKVAVLTLAALALCVPMTACCRRSDKGADPRPEALPALTLRDETPDLLLTWVDGNGEFHTTEHIADVPPEARSAVRVVVTTRDEGASGDLLYLADLTRKNPDGTYPVSTLTRAEWDSLAASRRRLTMPSEPSPSAPGAAGRDTAPGPSFGKVRVVIYGAAWCKPCHQAADYLRGKGVAVVQKDIERDEGADEEMQHKLERAGLRGGSIPVLDVGGKLMVGFDPRAVDAALASASRDTTTL